MIGPYPSTEDSELYTGSNSEGGGGGVNLLGARKTEKRITVPGSVDRWMDGWMDGRTDGRTDGWIVPLSKNLLTNIRIKTIMI